MQYARARSRIAKSLGLDAPGAEASRPVRQRRKPVTYNFEDYDRNMRVRVRGGGNTGAGAAMGAGAAGGVSCSAHLLTSVMQEGKLRQ